MTFLIRHCQFDLIFWKGNFRGKMQNNFWINTVYSE